MEKFASMCWLQVKNYLTTKEGRTEEGMFMEQLISETIYQNDGAPLRQPVVGFYCYIWSVLEGNDAKVTLVVVADNNRYVFMPPPFDEWWRGIKCYPCPSVCYQNLVSTQ